MTYDLLRLKAELESAGVSHNGLGMAPVEGGEYEVFTYSVDGQIIALPKEAEAVIRTHTPPPPPEKVDIGEDVATDQGDRMADAATALTTYLRSATPTGAQSAAALKILIQVVLYILKHRLGY